MIPNAQLALSSPARRLAGLVLAGALGLALPMPAAQTNQSAAPAAAPAAALVRPAAELATLMAAIPKSEFVFEAEVSRDPFFPKSSRLRPTAPASALGTAPTPQDLTSGLALKGFLGSPTKPLALLNNRTCAPGEEVVVKLPGGQLKVRCVEIRQKSVVVTIEGEPGRKELFLRAGP
ncbi:MAG: hypothetical protein HYY24_01910 [Verrucomicrobia bacterium]|nr:hypothetical protein [Verrucomicrobiota bacterium]